MTNTDALSDADLVLKMAEIVDQLTPNDYEFYQDAEECVYVLGRKLWSIGRLRAIGIVEKYHKHDAASS